MISVPAGTDEIHLLWVKSPGGEIPLRGVKDGFHFTCGQSSKISPTASAVDFTVSEANDFTIAFMQPI